MDGPGFDDLTKALTRGDSRRRVLKVLGGGLVASLAAAFAGGAEAKGAGNKDKPCDGCLCQRYDRKAGICVQRCKAAVGEDCVGGDCQRVCPEGESFCVRSGDPCEGSGCRCAAQGKECVEVDIGSGQRHTCCCDDKLCSCSRDVGLCCARGDVCDPASKCCSTATGEGYCISFPVFQVPRT